jgi:hypothetical protein
MMLRPLAGAFKLVLLQGEVAVNTETLTEAEVLGLGTMQSDEDDLVRLDFPVSEQLQEKIKDQYQRVMLGMGKGDDDWLNPVVRYRRSREAGVLAAVAKGVKNRAFRENELFIPKSELDVSEGKVRISALKATLAVPAALKVKSIVFNIGDDGVTGSILGELRS